MDSRICFMKIAYHGTIVVVPLLMIFSNIAFIKKTLYKISRTDQYFTLSRSDKRIQILYFWTVVAINVTDGTCNGFH